MTPADLMALIAAAPWHHLMLALSDTADTIAAQRGTGDGQNGWV